jgi:hypothetical protein
LGEKSIIKALAGLQAFADGQKSVPQ